MHGADGLTVYIVVRRSALQDIVGAVRSSLEAALRDAGAACSIAIEVVDRIAREPGPAAKVKLVRSELR